MPCRSRSALLVLLALCLSAPTSAQDTDVRVMSFNIRYGTARDGRDSWPNRKAFVFDLIRDAAPDLLGVQEALAFQVDELQEALPSYASIGVGRTDGQREGEFAAIFLDRDRFEALDHGTFWFSDTPAVPGSTSWGNTITRICTWAHVRDLRNDKAFYIYNVHWDHESQPSRERSALLLVERIRLRATFEDPVIVTGDFNAGEPNPAFQYLIGSGLIDTFRARHPTASVVGTFNGFRGDDSGEKIDAVLISPGWSVLDAAIVRTHYDGRYPSDHFPVTAVLRMAR